MGKPSQSSLRDAQEGALREEPLPSCRCASSHPLPTLSLTRHLSPAGESLSKGTALAVAGNFLAKPQGIRQYKRRPLRRSRARFPLLSPTVTSSPGAGEVFPQRGSQAARLVAKVLGIMRKCPAAMTERAHAGKNPFRLAAARQATFPKGTALAMAGNFAAASKGAPLGELAR